MKELSTEEKAKAYDEALERAREWYNDPHITIGLKGNLEDIFPELKESKDEKVRKRLIDLIYKVYANTSYITCVEHEDMLAWLEKQEGKHKTEPQSRWRPSEEQMYALAWALSLAKNCGDECAFDLRTLLEQLKNL